MGGCEGPPWGAIGDPMGRHLADLTWEVREDVTDGARGSGRVEVAQAQSMKVDLARGSRQGEEVVARGVKL